MTSQEERARAILAATAKVAEWIGFSGGAIKDGLGWTDGARKLHDETRAALAVLSDAPFALAAEVREDAAKVAEEIDLFDGDRLKNSDPRTTIAAAIRAQGG